MNLILTFLRPYLLRIILGASVAAMVGGGFLYIKVHYQNIGYAKAVHDIAAKDERAIRAVNDAIKTVDDCYAAGKQWDTTRGVCN